MGKSKKDNTQAAPSAQKVISGNTEQKETKEERYVVVREGHRVSPQEYSTATDPKAIEEMAFWRLVETNHSWGAPVEIVKYDNHLHRIYSVGENEE